MRSLARAALTASFALAMLAGAAPASADPLPSSTCPGGEPTCLYFSGSYPVKNPVVVPGQTVSPRYVQGPRVCDSSGTSCYALWFGLPGASIDSNGNTIGTLDIPGFGVGVSSTGVLTAYVTTLPTFTPSGSPVGVTASVTVHDFLVLVDAPNIAYMCAEDMDSTYGPLNVTHAGCATTLTVRV